MRILILLIGMLSATASLAQTGYKLSFRVKGWKDTTVYLGHYYGESTFIRDTARVKNEKFVFDGKTDLPQGVYFLVLNKTKLFDFVVGADQDFQMETEADDLFTKMKVTGDPDNDAFFESVRFNAKMHEEADPYVKILQDSTVKEDLKAEARAKYAKVDERVKAFQMEIINRDPKLVTSRVFKSTFSVTVPDAPKKADGSIDSLFQFKYYRAHFFDNFDLADDALIRMPKPIYQDKLKEYLDKLFLQQPDTISNGIYKLADHAKSNPETYKFLVYTCMFLYQAPDVMGLDEVFVNLNKKYFASGEMDFWANVALKKNMKEHAEKISRAMIGRTAPNLMMQDQNLKPKSMYDIKKKYTLVYFFDPDCGHCRVETPKLVSFYNKYKTKFDLEVFAVSADTSLQKMKDYIKEMKMTWITVNEPRTYIDEPYRNLYYAETTPTLYILDDKKKVVARKLPVEKVEEFLTNYEKYLKRKAPASPKGT
jgi:peroxiredoxin